MKVRIRLILLILIALGFSGNTFADINSDLRIASAQGQTSKVKELIGRGADVNAGGLQRTKFPKGQRL